MILLTLNFIGIIYQTNKYIFTTKFAHTNLSFFRRQLHKNALSIDDQEYSDNDDGCFNMRKLQAILKFYSEHNTLKFFATIILIVIVSVAAPFFVEDGCISKYDEFS